jgi:hypothetical protein
MFLFTVSSHGPKTKPLQILSVPCTAVTDAVPATTVATSEQVMCNTTVQQP